MSEGIAFQTLLQKAPRRSAARLWLHSEVTRRINRRRKRQIQEKMHSRSMLERIFAVGSYALVVAEEKSVEGMD